MTASETTAIDETSPAREEAELISRLKVGEEDAFALVLRQYGPRLLAVARRFLANDEDAQDVLQEAIFSVFKAVDRFQGEARLATWLHRITVNAALMKLRSRKARPERAIEDLLPRYLEDGHRADVEDAWTLTCDRAVASRETQEIVRRCIDQLPEAYRVVLLLRDIEEKCTEEVAELLEIEPGAVKTRLHRARQALRTLLDPYMRGTP